MLPIVIKISTFWVKKVATTAVIFLRPILLDKVKSFKEVKNWTDKFFPIYHIGFSRVKIRLGMNLVWGSGFFVWLWRFEVQFWRINLGSGGSRFRIFKFVAISNGKFTHFLIFYAVRTFSLVQGSEVRSSVSENKPRWGKFKIKFHSSTNQIIEEPTK